MSNARRTYAESCHLLQTLGILPKGDIPPLPAVMPAFDDAHLGVSFFRTFLGDKALENLALPRTYFGRSEIRGTSFKNSDLSESRLCWNDFIDVNFTEATLRGSDLRASVYERVKFVRADLQNADLRCAKFEDCHFAGANFRGAKATKGARILESLAPEQLAGINYQPEGEEPPGG
jgi:uncharacterized protein YjbI with pentapeptide repeats